MTNPKVIIFDYGNVLDIPDSWEQWWAHWDKEAAAHGLSHEEFFDLFNRSEMWQQAKRGQITRDEFVRQMLEPLGYAQPADREAYLDRLFESRNRIDPRMMQLLRELHTHYRLAILSNTAIIEMERWLAEERDAAGLFDLVVSSAQVGMAKPDTDIYTYTIDKLGIQPEEGLFVDDLSRNTKVAESIGLPCIVFESPEQLRQELAQRGIWPVKIEQ